MEVAPCLAAFCPRQNFGGFCRGLKGMQASPPRPRAKPTGISAHALKFCPRQGRKPFDLKRLHSLTGRTHSQSEYSQNEKSSLVAFIKFRSSLFKGLRFPKAEPLVALRRGRKPLYRVSFCLAFSLRVLPAKKKRL